MQHPRFTDRTNIAVRRTRSTMDRLNEPANDSLGNGLADTGTAV